MRNDHSSGPTAVILALVFLLMFLNYGYFYQGGGPNQFSRYALTATMAEQGSVGIDAYHHLTFDKAVKDGHFFSDKPPGLSLLGVPVFLLLQLLLRPQLGMAAADWQNCLLYGLTLLTVSLPVALAITSFFRRAWQEAGPRPAFWITMALGLGSPLTAYASLYYSHALCAALLWFSFSLITRSALDGQSISLVRYALAGLLAGWATLSEMPTALITVSLLGYVFLSTLWSPRPTLAFVVGGLPTLGILLTYNWLAFGDPFTTGYKYCYVEEFRIAMSKGIMGVTWPTWEAFQGIVFGTRCGLLFYWPFCFFCVIPSVGILFIRKRIHGPAWLALVICGLYLLFGCSYFLWTGGAAFGPRHLVPCLPFAAYLVVRVAEFLPRSLLLIFALASVAIVLVSVSTIAEFPEGADFPLKYATALFLTGRISVKIVGAEGRFGIPQNVLGPDDPGYYDAVNLGEMCGLSGTLSVLPLVVVSLILAGVIWRLGTRTEIKGPASR